MSSTASMSPNFNPGQNVSIRAALSGQSLLLTGATGFLGKIILEKILRSVPSIGEVFVLVRPRKGSSASERMHAEIIHSPVFDRLRNEIGIAKFTELVNQKVRALPGELTLADIGLSAEQLAALYPRLNFIIHSAAVVDFNERLDRAVELNVLGSLRLLEIAQRCKNMRGFVHVSTCYVNSNRKGWVEEKLYPLGYDPDEMLERVRSMKENELDKIAGSGLLAEWPNTYTFTKAMTEHLMEKRRGNVPLMIVRPSIIGSSWRDPVPGWVDCISAAGAVYVAVGLGLLKMIPGQMDNVSDVIPADYVTNAILGSLASIAGRYKEFGIIHASSSTENTMHWGAVLDCVVNFFVQNPPARRVASPQGFQMVSSAQLFQLLFFLKYSIPSAVLNTVGPLGTKAFRQKAVLFNKLVWRARVIIESFRYFTENQWSFHNANARAIGSCLVPEEQEIFSVRLKGLDWIDYNRNFCYGLCKYVLRMDLIEPELDDPSHGSPRKVRLELNKGHWYQACPQRAQIVRSALGNEEFIEEQVAKFPPAFPIDMSFSPSVHEMSQRTFYDLHWMHRVLNDRSKLVFGALHRTKTEMRKLVLGHPELQKVIKEIVDKDGMNLGQNGSKGLSKPAAPSSNDSSSGGGKKKHPSIRLSDVEARAAAIAEKMFGETHMGLIASMGYAFKKLWRKIYESIQIEKDGLERLQQLVQNDPKTSVVYIPTHRSYVDFLIISYITYACRLPVPFIAAGEDFLGIFLVRWLFRHSGAFFIRRSFLDGGKLNADAYLYQTIFKIYLQTLLVDGQSLEFYIEGTRSRSGKMLHPKTGMLATVTDMVLGPKRQVSNVHIVPIAINYEKTIEGELYSNELLGENKIKESFKNLAKSSTKFLGPQGSGQFGTISVIVQPPINLKEYAKKYVAEVLPKEQARMDELAQQQPTSDSTAPNFGVPASSSSSTVKPNPTSVNGASTTSSEEDANAFTSGSKQVLVPLAFRKHFNKYLAYEIIYSMQRGSECMPTHLVSTLMLMYRQGITRAQLVSKVEWLRNEVHARGGCTNNFSTNQRAEVVTKAIGFLDKVIVQRRSELYEAAINSRSEYKNMLVLGHYRNKIVHLFFHEGIFACALYALLEKQEQQQQQNGNGHGSASSAASSSSSAAVSSSSASSSAGVGVARPVLLTEVEFLFTLLQREFITSSTIPDRIDSKATIERVLEVMIAKGIFKLSSSASGEQLVEVASTGETHFSFLCALIWPFIDSYYASAMVLFSLQPNKQMEETQLLQRTQWLATTLYHESMLCFYESCSMDTLRNAFDVYHKWQILAAEKVRGGSGSGGGGGPNLQGSGGTHPALMPPPPAKTFVRLTPKYANDEQALQALITKINFLRKPPPVKRTSMRKNLIADLPVLAKL